MRQTATARLILSAVLAAMALPAAAHFPFDMAGPGPSLDQAVLLPSAQASWNVYGILAEPGQTDFIRLNDVNNDLVVDVTARTFAKQAYLNFAPSVALLGPGLPPPTEALPFALPGGYGALVRHFEGDPTLRKVNGTGTRTTFDGVRFDMPDLTGGPAYLAVWSPDGRTGQYNILYNIVPDIERPEYEGKYTQPLMGDADEDGQITVADVRTALRISLGLQALWSRRLRSLDVAPRKMDPFLHGDGRIDASDVVRLLRRTLGVEPDPFP